FRSSCRCRDSCRGVAARDLAGVSQLFADVVSQYSGRYVYQLIAPDSGVSSQHEFLCGCRLARLRLGVAVDDGNAWRFELSHRDEPLEISPRRDKAAMPIGVRSRLSVNVAAGMAA